MSKFVKLDKMTNLTIMRLYRMIVLTLVLSLSFFYIKETMVRTWLLFLIVLFVFVFWKEIWKVIRYDWMKYVLVFVLTVLICLIVFKVETKKKVFVFGDTNRVVVIRESLNSIDYNLTLVRSLNNKENILLKTKIFERYKINDVLVLEGMVKENKTKFNPFDILIFNRINYKIDYPNVKFDSKIDGFNFWKAIAGLRLKIDNKIKKLFNSLNYNFISMLLLGKTVVSDRELSNLFKESGMSHILVVSGTHLSILFSFLIYLFLFVFSNIYLSSLVIIICLVLFTILSGLASSIVRAAILFVLVLIGRLSSRIINYTNILFLIILCMFVVSPSLIVLDLGFQLSFLSIASLIYLNPIVKEIAFKKMEGRSNLSDLLMMTICSVLSINLVLIPFLVYNFMEFNLSSIFFNILLIPVSGIVLTLIFSNVLIGFVSLWLGLGFALVTNILVSVFINIIYRFGFLKILWKPMMFNSIYFVMFYYWLLIVLVVKFYSENKELTLNI